MLECRSCVLRCIRAIGPEISSAQYAFGRSLALTLRLTDGLRRGYASAANVSEVHDDLEGSAAWIGHSMAQDKVSKQQPRRPPTSNERALRTEMRYLRDPVKFAEHVHYTLRCNNPEKALELCRLGSRSLNCVVAWNHTINWLMKKERINEAIKVYNEMKKRAQFPDSYTYLLLLRGFPQYRTHHVADVKKEMVAKAISIYRSMSSLTSKVKPSIIHTNAILRVCSLGRDMDTLWEIVSQLPETGPDSADSITYTILLSAIRYTARSDEPHPSLEQVSQTRQRAVEEGKRIWQEIVTRWRGGEVLIDEQLVCEMGNLLLVSKRIEDWDDVLNLVQQTTNIKRLLPPLGSPERHVEHVPTLRETSEDGAAGSDQEHDSWTPTPADNAFKPVEIQRRADGKHQRSGPPAWVQPSNPILSVIMVACTNMRSAKALTQYWDLLVKDYGITPDRANYQALLRFCRTNRNSARAASVIQEMSDRGVELHNQTFRIALSACTRNPRNPNVLGHARSIVEQMYRSQSNPDIPTLEGYLELAKTIKDRPQILSVLDRLTETMDVLISQMESEARSNSPGYRAAASFFRVVIGAINVLCQDESVLEKDRKRWKTKRIELDRFVGHAAINVGDPGQREDPREGSTRHRMHVRRALH